MQPKKIGKCFNFHRIFEKSMKNDDKLDKLFRRQLAVPLLNMETTMEEYKEFLGSKPLDEGVEAQYAAALEMVSKRQAFESDLMDLDKKEKDKGEQEKDTKKRMQIYADYLTVEFSEGKT